MAEVIVLLLLATFVVLMILFHKFGSWCAPRPRSIEPTGISTAQHAIIMPTHTPHGDVIMHGYSPMTPRSNDRGCGTPRSDYNITISDDGITAVRETRVISFIRFSGYTDSEASISERSTGLSFWSALSNAKELEYSAAEPVGPLSPPPPQHSRPYIPRVDSPPYDDIDRVEIEAMEGFAQRNMLAFKPHKPRVLKTKRLKKPTFSRPAHVFLV